MYHGGKETRYTMSLLCATAGSHDIPPCMVRSQSPHVIDSEYHGTIASTEI